MPRRVTVLLPLIGLLMLLSLPALANAASFKWNKAIRVESYKLGGFDAVSCPDLQLCVAGDQSGNIVTSSTPTKGGWSASVKVDKLGPITGVSCPTTTFCAAVDQTGGFIYSKSPTKGAKDWSHPVRIDAATAVGGGYAGLEAISCPSASLCVAVDNGSSSNVVYSTDPTGGAAAWKTVKLEGPATSVDCPSVSLCVIAGSERYVSTDPAVPTSWKAAGALIGGVYADVACVGDRTLCIGVGFGDSSPGFESSTGNAAGAWGTVYNVLDDPPAIGSSLLEAVGCTRGVCVALDGADNAYVDASLSAGTWGAGTAIRPKSESTSNAVSCTAGMCVVVDSSGVETTGLLK